MAARILLADADEATRALYARSLKVSACDIVEVSDGRDALVNALVHEPSLVVTELDLPNVDGFALCQILRHDRTTAGVPIMVVTSETRPLEIERARQVGANIVLQKPIQIDVLLQEASRLLLHSHDLRYRAAMARKRAAEQLLRSASLLRRRVS